jgi:hypothetical protein
MVILLISPWLARAEQSRTLESSALRVEVTLKPYSYQVVEKSTGGVLLSESSMVVLFGKELYPVTDAIENSSNGSELRVTVALQTSGRDQLPSGTPDRAQISFTFLKPEILRVHITYPGGSPDEISDEFFDRGEHYYGVWEYPFGGNIDNRGADQDFLGLANQRYVHHKLLLSGPRIDLRRSIRSVVRTDSQPL